MIGEVDFGTKYPIFVKPWKEKPVKKFNYNVNMIDLDNDEKSPSSDLDESDLVEVRQPCFEIVGCQSFNIVTLPLSYIPSTPVTLSVEYQNPINCY